MKKILSVLILLLTCAALSAQTMRDVVSLKNGSTIKGVILELNPEGNVKIQTSDGSIFVFPMTDVEKITKEVQEQPTPLSNGTGIENKISSTGFIYTIDGKMYFTEAMGLTKERIPVKDGESHKIIPMSNIVLYEAMEVEDEGEEGIVFLQKDKIMNVEPVSYNGDFISFFAQDKRVYIPLSSSITEQQWGAKRLRELLIQDGFWKIVGCEEEADFILRYVFDDRGSDHSYIVIYDRMGQEVYKSKKERARLPRVGEKTAENLYKNCIKKRLQNRIKPNNASLSYLYPVPVQNASLPSLIPDAVQNAIIQNKKGAEEEVEICIIDGLKSFREKDSEKIIPIEDIAALFIEAHNLQEIPPLPCLGYILYKRDGYEVEIYGIENGRIKYSFPGENKLKEVKLNHIERVSFLYKDCGVKLYYYYIPK